MLRRIAFGALALTAGVGMMGIMTAGADEAAPQPTVAFNAAAVISSGMTAIVPITYKCSSTVSPANHLFVAVKQGPQVNDTTHTSSDFANSFLSTNWKSDSGPNALTCDGKQHNQMIVVKQQPGFDGVPLHTGPALVQLCLYDNVTGFSGYEPVGGFAPSYTMQTVVVGGGHR